MILQDIDINALKPAPYNPRIKLKPGTPRFEKLKRSLETYELVQPIVWNEQTGHIVGGHQRVEVLRHLGFKSVPVVVVHLDLPHEQALNITLNNSQVGSDWDHDKLVGILEELAAAPEQDSLLTGFDPQQLQDLCFKSNPDFAQSHTEQEANIQTQEIQVTLKIPPAHWDNAEIFLNDFLSEIPAKMILVQ